VYQLPVAAGGVFTARLRFCPIDVTGQQPADGASNVLDVYLNGSTLLDNFALPPLGTQSHSCIVKQFTGLKSNAQGKLIFSFVPTQGYASVNSIAIDEE
jgi:hypothetical protein